MLIDKTQQNTLIHGGESMIAHSSLFAQAISMINRNDFYRAVKRHGAEKHSKGFSSWDQFVSMVFCQTAGADSLREIHGGLASAAGKLSHLGMKEAPPKSTLAYANAHRPWQVFKDMFHHVLEKCRSVAFLKGKQFRFKNKFLTIDASVIKLCSTMFDWAKYRRAKGAIKLNVLLDNRGHLPCWAHLTEGRVHEVNVLKKLSFERGTILAADRGYWDYGLFGRWADEGVYFVMRAKKNMACEVVDGRDVPAAGNVYEDSTIRFTGAKARKDCPHKLRMIAVYDEKKDEEFYIVTNIFHLSANTVAAIYKERWQIELFFKALKQNLKVKTFVGTTENAVQIQIWTALIVILLLKFMKLKSTFGWSFSNLVAMFRMNLLTYRDLWRWLDEPYGTPVIEPREVQLSFFN